MSSSGDVTLDNWLNFLYFPCINIILRFCALSNSDHWHLLCIKTLVAPSRTLIAQDNECIRSQYSGVSRISLRWGANPPGWFCQIFPKTAWNWRNLDPRRGARPLDPPLIYIFRLSVYWALRACVCTFLAVLWTENSHKLSKIFTYY